MIRNIRLDSFMVPFKELLPEVKDTVFMIVVYENPLDFPEPIFVARLFVLDKPTAYIVIRKTVEEIDDTIPDYMVHMSPDLMDDPTIIAIYV